MMYGALEFEECANSQLEAGFEKVALYATDRGTVTHAARQLKNGLWTSKLGPNHDVEHTIEALEGGLYGRAIKFLRRAIK